MRCIALTAACLAAWWSLPISAQAQTDPLRSPACQEALAALEAARSAPAQNASERSVRVEYARGEAARLCLGASPGASRPPPLEQPPVRLPPPVLTPPTPPTTPAEPLLRPPAYRSPPVVTACDAGGCWDSDGRRLNGSGPQLQGPGGVCVQQGGTLLCP